MAGKFSRLSICLWPRMVTFERRIHRIQRKYAFNGLLSAEPNEYKFYSQPSGVRTPDAELLTRFGEKFSGTPYTVFFNGGKQISTSGQFQDGPQGR